MITQEELKTLLYYDKNSGIFYRIKTSSPAGYTMNTGYVMIRVHNIRYYAHKLAWLYEYGEYPIMIDHIDKNRSNNRISNLRLTNYKENIRNTNLYSNNTSGYKGIRVTPNNKFEVSCKIDMKFVYIGRFINLDEAIFAYDYINMLFYPETYEPRKVSLDDNSKLSVMNIVKKVVASKLI